MRSIELDSGRNAPEIQSLTLFPANTSDLIDLARAINAAHSEAKTYASKAVDRALVAGDLLLKAKAQCHHGQWLEWLKEHCPAISAKTASNWMRLAKEKHQIGNVADLTIRGALELLNDAKPDTEIDPLESWLSGLLTDSRFPIGSIGWLMDIPPAVIFLDAIGWNQSAIAERLTIPEKTVSALLDPQPFERPDLSPHELHPSLNYLTPVVDRCQREYHWHVAAQLADQRGFFCRNVSAIARKFNRSDLAERFAGMEQVYFREGERAHNKIPEWRKTTPDDLNEADLLLIGAFTSAITDTSVAFTGQPPELPDDPVTRFIAKMWLDYYSPQIAANVESRFPDVAALSGLEAQP